MATTTEIRDRTAYALGVAPVGQTPQNQHATRITTAYNEVYQALKARRLVTWTSTGDIPDEVAEHVISLVAYNCMNSGYGVSQERGERIRIAKAQADREIPELLRPRWQTIEPNVDF